MAGKITGLRHDCAWCYLSEGRSYGGKGHRSTFHPVHPHWKGVVVSLIQTQQESSLKEFLISPRKISLEHMQRLKQQCISVFYLSFYVLVNCKRGFPSGSEGKASACNVGDPGSIPGSGRSPGEGNGNPLQYSCLEKPMDGEAWQATVHGVAKSRTQLSNFT